MTPRHLLEPGRLAGAALLKAQSDSRLVDMTRAGNDRAFEAIVERHKGALLRYCSRILPDGRGEDAVQQAFVNAYDALHRDTTPLALRSWLFGIAHNVALNLLRQRGGDHEPLGPHAGTAEAADATLERRDGGDHLAEALAPLDRRVGGLVHSGMRLERLVIASALAQDVQGDVVADPEEPAA